MNVGIQTENIIWYCVIVRDVITRNWTWFSFIQVAYICDSIWLSPIRVPFLMKSDLSPLLPVSDSSIILDSMLQFLKYEFCKPLISLCYCYCLDFLKKSDLKFLVFPTCHQGHGGVECAHNIFLPASFYLHNNLWFRLQWQMQLTHG